MATFTKIREQMVSQRQTLLEILLLCVLVAGAASISPAQPENPGPHQPGWTQQTIQRSSRSLVCRIYYPAFRDSGEAQIDTLHGPYPIVAFGHGFFMQTGYYLSLFRHLASHGYVVIAPQFPDTQHGELADDLLFCVGYMRQQHATPSSRFFRLVDTSSAGLSGHSMGGGASLLAAARDSRIAVVAPLAPAETTPSAIAAMNQIRGVVYLIAGASDGITPPPTNQLPMYTNANPLKGLTIIIGANHTRFMDVSTFDFTDPNGNLTRPQQLLITRRSLTSIFNLVLKRDPLYWVYAFGDSATGDTRLTFSWRGRSLTPFPFSLVSPDSISTTLPVRFAWRRATTLNPAESVRYILHVASSPAFVDSVAFLRAITDTTQFVGSLQPGHAYFWRVTATTSDSTQRACSRPFTFFLTLASVFSGGEPTDVHLAQNFPNPFNPGTSFEFRVPSSELVTLKVFDLLGREVATLVNEVKQPGTYTVRWDAQSLPSGMYLCRLQSGDKTLTRKLLLLR